jgi:hypothetical protein
LWLDCSARAAQHVLGTEAEIIQVLLQAAFWHNEENQVLVTKSYVTGRNQYGAGF